MAHEPNPVVFWEERLTSKPPPLHSKWDSVLARCLDPDPARRFKDADEVIQALGPSRARRWFLAAAAAAVLAVASGVITYQGATAPKETVRLAVLPFAANQGAAGLAENLLRDGAGQVARLKSSPNTTLIVVPVATILRNRVKTTDQARLVLGATHSLHGTLERVKERVILHAFITDTRSGVNVKEWKAEYAPGQMRYAPVALAGIVTGSLHLPPLIQATVNPAAHADYLTGLSYLRTDTRVDDALASLERTIVADPDSVLTYAGLAEAQWSKYSLTEDPRWLERTSESVQQAMLRNTDAAQVHRVSGLILADAGYYESAEAEYHRAIELDPGNGDAYRRLGRAYERNSQLKEALTAYRRAIELDPQYYRNYLALGAFYFQQANYSEAVKHFRKTVELAPDQPDAHFALATGFMNLGQFPQAEDELRFAIRLADTPTALHTLGVTLMYQQRDREAIQYISRALSLGTERYLWWMNIGTAYRRIGLKAESARANLRGLHLAESELAHDPRSGAVRSHVAYLCARLGDRTRAESEIAQALQLSPSHADTCWMAAATYEALGQRDKALALLSASPDGVLADVSRWPDLADLHQDPRFKQLLASREIK